MKWIILVFELYPPTTHFRTLQNSVNTNSFFSHVGKSLLKKKSTMRVVHIHDPLNTCAGCLFLLSLQVWNGDWQKWACGRDTEWAAVVSLRSPPYPSPGVEERGEHDRWGGCQQQSTIDWERRQAKSLRKCWFVVFFLANFYVAYAEQKSPV